MIIYKTKKTKVISLPLFSNTVKAGFPSPADDYINEKLDLNDYLIEHTNASFLVKVDGESMIGAGIFPGDILIVDRSVGVKNDNIILAIVDNEFTVKRYSKVGGKIYLKPENPLFEPITVEGEMTFEVWGVVVGMVRKM